MVRDDSARKIINSAFRDVVDELIENVNQTSSFENSSNLNTKEKEIFNRLI